MNKETISVYSENTKKNPYWLPSLLFWEVLMEKFDSSSNGKYY